MVTILRSCPSILPRGTHYQYPASRYPGARLSRQMVPGLRAQKTIVWRRPLVHWLTR